MPEPNTPVAPNTLAVDIYRVLAECVERGIERGWYRAHKHDEDPPPENIRHHIEQEVMNEVCEYFRFPE